MEKKTKSLGEHLPPVRLFITDIKKLYDIFYSTNNEVRIETENHIINNLDELSLLDEVKINNLSLKISQPYVSLNMENSSIWLYTSSDDYLSKGIFNELKTYLFSKRRKLYKVIESPIIAGMINGLLMGANLVYYRISIIYGLIATLTLLLSFLYTKWVINRIIHWHTIIFLKKDKNELSFWIRKKDDIILIVISSILGAILGVLATYLITK